MEEVVLVAGLAPASTTGKWTELIRVRLQRMDTDTAIIQNTCSIVK